MSIKSIAYDLSKEKSLKFLCKNCNKPLRTGQISVPEPNNLYDNNTESTMESEDNPYIVVCDCGQNYEIYISSSNDDIDIVITPDIDMTTLKII